MDYLHQPFERRFLYVHVNGVFIGYDSCGKQYKPNPSDTASFQVYINASACWKTPEHQPGHTNQAPLAWTSGCHYSEQICNGEVGKIGKWGTICARETSVLLSDEGSPCLWAIMEV